MQGDESEKDCFYAATSDAKAVPPRVSFLSAGLLCGPVSISFGPEPSIPNTNPVVFVGSFDCWL
jgi:hypothetical protein